MKNAKVLYRETFVVYGNLSMLRVKLIVAILLPVQRKAVNDEKSLCGKIS